MKSRLTALTVALMILTWTSAFVVITLVTPNVSPLALAAGRLLVGAAVLTVLWCLRALDQGGVQLHGGRILALIVTFGVLWFALYPAVAYALERHLNSGTVALLVNFAPIIIAPIALGVPILRSGPIAGAVDPLSASTLGAIIGALMLGPWAPQLLRELATAPISSAAAVMYLGAVPTALGSLLWVSALIRRARHQPSKSPATRAHRPASSPHSSSTAEATC